MKFLCTLSVTVRLAGLAFFVGLVLGLAIGYRSIDDAAGLSHASVAAALSPARQFSSPPPVVLPEGGVNATDVPEVDKECTSG